MELTDNLEIAFSVAVIGLLIGGLAYVIGLVRDRMYSQDISDLEYLLELLEGNAGRLDSGRRRDRLGRWEGDPFVTYVDVPDTDGTTATMEPVATAGELPAQNPAVEPPAAVSQPGPASPTPPAVSFDDPDMSWHTDDDPFAALGPAEAPRREPTRPPAGPEPTDQGALGDREST